MANSEDIKNLVFQGHQFIENHQIYSLNKLNGKEICSILIESVDSKPSSQFYHKNVFQNSSLDWKNIYVLLGIATKDSRLRVFRYKLLNNVLYLIKCFSGLEKLIHLSAPSVK